MDDDRDMSNTYSIFMMLIVILILGTVNCLEVMNLTEQWQNALTLNHYYFDKCLKYPFVLKSFFILFSILATISIFGLIVGLLSNPQFFIKKLFSTLINFIHSIYGPSLTISAILGIYHWKELVYTCDGKSSNTLSISNAFAIVFSFIVGIIIWISKDIYDVLILFSNSITRHTDGNPLIRQAFWNFILKIKLNETYSNYRRDAELLRRNEMSFVNARNVNNSIELIEEEKTNDETLIRCDINAINSSNQILENNKYIELGDKELKNSYEHINNFDSIITTDKTNNKFYIDNKNKKED